jgi:hypothetical protein
MACSLNMVHFSKEPFNLEGDELVVARAEAINQNGRSDPSPVTVDEFGARMVKMPSLSTPKLVSKTATSVKISWNLVTNAIEPYIYEVFYA